MDLSGKSAVITGAGSGIGQATAQRLADEGANVVLTDLDSQAADQAAAEIAEVSTECSSYQLDVRDRARFATVLSEVSDQFDGLDILINNAGIGGAEEFDSIGDQKLDEVIQTNIYGTWNGCQEAVPLMQDNDGGAIVNVASIGGFLGMKYHSHYCLSKGAVLNLTRAIAVEYGSDNIRSNAVCPGTVETERIFRKYRDELSELHPEGVDGPTLLEAAMQQYPIGRFAAPGEVAACIAFLASSDASFVTGHGLVVDGGYSIS